MKYFYKLFLSIVLLLTLSIGILEYSFVRVSMQQNFDSRVAAEIEQHSLVQYSIQITLSYMSKEDEVLGIDYDEVLESAMKMSSIDGGVTLVREGKILLLDGIDGDYEIDQNNIKGVAFKVVDERSAQQLYLESQFEVGKIPYTLLTKRSISEVFSEADMLRDLGMKLYFVVLAFGALAAFLLSWLQTRPLRILQGTTYRFAQGNYKVRTDIKSKDEIGELARTYNLMADKLEEKIKELEEIAITQQNFTANFAHELKTPMTSMIGYADRIYQMSSADDEIKKCAWYILNEGMRLEALSFKLLELQTLHRAEFVLEETEIVPAMQDILDSIAVTMEKRGIRFKSQIEEAWVFLEFDLFKTMMLNLLDNAAKAGGKDVWLVGRIMDGHYKIEVIDNGRGMDREELLHITEAFYMGDKSRSRKEHGAGLGLALASQIAQIHDTKLEYKSKKTIGTKVEIKLRMEELYEKTQ